MPPPTPVKMLAMQSNEPRYAEARFPAADHEIEVFFGAWLIAVQGHQARDRCCQEPDSSAHPRSPEPRGRNAFEEGDSSRRVEAASRVGSDDLDPLRKSGGGSVRHERECALPAVLLPVSLPAGRGRSDIALVSSQAISVCPVRALRIFIDRSASFRQSDQLFVCYGGCAKCLAVSKRRLFHWVVDTNTAVIRAKVWNVLCTLGPTQQELSPPPGRGQETTNGPLCKASDPEACRKPAYCYNCSKKGHFGHECTEKRMYNGTYPTLPFLSRYDTKNDFHYREIRVKKQARELKQAGLISPDRAVITYTPQPPRKKQKNSHKQSPYPYNTHTNNQNTPKRRIAHTPKHTYFNVKQNSETPGNHGKHTPKSKFKPQDQSQNEAKKKKKKTQSEVVLDEDADFRRGCKKSPHKTRDVSSPRKANVKPNKPFGMEKNNKKDKLSKKKERKWQKRERKAAKDSSMYPSDENLFQIKQRKHPSSTTNGMTLGAGLSVWPTNGRCGSGN
ncbi:uncharacterized protein [Sinocyclocheilus grahami]|uniref:uncharacterized protein n=1 Tax=Sinocyclocheilus grahami TaxID=75366 RepID=UPI0007AC938A|nr:PREDICTED: uncharacterized protein LOC107548298 [Sinocyclocheilus grahami]